MKKYYLDSNFLIYLKNEDIPSHKEAVSILEKIVESNSEVFISSLVIDEFLHSIRLGLIINKHKDLFPTLKSTLNDILSIPLLSIVNPPTDLKGQNKIVDYMEKYSLRARDAYHLLTMVFHGIDHFATFDHDFEKVFKSGLLHKAV